MVLASGGEHVLDFGHHGIRFRLRGERGLLNGGAPREIRSHASSLKGQR